MPINNEELSEEALLDIIRYSARVFNSGLSGKPTSLGMDLALARLKNAADEQLSERELELLERSGTHGPVR
ncbi:hypothetical protein [Neptuniibacter sp. QD37_11]|uniref:hypothetical protein n=1 Tax=Neptuniibacter sp. QD37_11 TaxID=3398209 RepID=UPI0039F50829